MPVRRPGFGLPHDAIPAYTPRQIHDDPEPTAEQIELSKNRFPTYWDLGHYPIVVREREMLRVVDKLSDKPEWRRKVFDDAIVEKWRAEAKDQMTWYSDDTFDLIIAELREKAQHFQESGMVLVYDVDHGVVKSDEIVSEELRQRLRQLVKAKLEDGGTKDWHPGSNEMVLDLVHPSLNPIIYGQSKAMPKRLVGLEDCVQLSLSGEVISKPEKEIDRHSNRHQWLPCEVSVGGEGPKITSYINNLHPQQRELYAVIEEFIGKSIPLWGQCLERGGRIGLESRIRIPMPDTDDLYTYPRGREKPDDDDMEEDENDSDDDGSEDDSDDEDAWARRTRELNMPDPVSTTGRLGVEVGATRFERLIKEKKGLQVIVKLANIHLTPEKPKYSGSKWHLEGMLNDHIVATSLYYYDSENITDTEVNFRRNVATWDLTLLPEQSDFVGVEEMYDIENEAPSIQELGSVSTRQGRLLVFPNVLLHCISDFRLQDPTKPGHRKLLALFLVDPHITVLSTANVAPQRKDWWVDVVRQTCPTLGDQPPEIFDRIMDFVGLEGSPIGRQQAEEERKLFMEERSAAANALKFDGPEFDFCEH